MDNQGNTEPNLRVLRQCRVVLVDQLEEHIGSLLEQLLLRDVFTRDDREEVLCEGGPRAQVRKTLDIVDCKGEEAAAEFRLLCSRLTEPGPMKQQQPDSKKAIPEISLLSLIIGNSLHKIFSVCFYTSSLLSTTNYSFITL
uniref:CARD domain-containing protein n=1 Tax=Paramormyrops kingsleyae TaxID=1676925 RepID=A0A3B3QNR8_9TELE